MTPTNQVSWGGYEFSVVESPETAAWNDVPGVYIFAKLDATGRWWQPLYIGETTSFKNRLTTHHERWQDAISSGVTHIHARVVANQYDRIAIERQLIESFAPAMNTA